MPSTYLYPGTNILRNKPGILNESALRNFEYEQVKLRSDELHQNPIKGNFDLKHLKKIRIHLFQDVYEWAGQLRTVNIGKGGDLFANTLYLEDYARKLSTSLAKENFLKNLDKKGIVERIAVHFAEWNSLHPFREGNGRATRVFFAQLAREAGYMLDQTRINNNKDLWNFASKQSFNGNLEPIKKIFSRSIRPNRAIYFELVCNQKITKNEALNKHPELSIAFKTLTAAKKLLDEKFTDEKDKKDKALSMVSHRILEALDTGKIKEHNKYNSAQEKKNLSFYKKEILSKPIKPQETEIER